MKALMIVTAVLAALVSNASAQEAPAPSSSPTWTEVQRACGTEYREADKSARGTWQQFLSECKGRKGFVPKRSAGTFRLPDVQKN